jgi:2-C-methyl-D-erythritol 4-phosphate cytidylyltransferase/2-C-methyl-D-erythritol 2,4-cyclodiphosphate synthase
LPPGQSKRFNSNKPKQFITYKNKALFEHSLDKAIISKLFKKIILVVNDKKQIKKKYSKNVLIIKGGKERSDSSLIALKYIKKFNPNNVLIHDAARPNFTIKLLKNLIRSLKTNKASIPVISSKDSIKYKVKNQLFNLERKNSYLTQTPQAFKFKDIYNLSLKQNNIIQDEATLFINNNLKIKFINGETLNNKITFKEDIDNTKTYFGIGFDIHRLIENKKLYLGGIKVPYHSGLKGHSDGDVILHSIIDALLGAMRKKDIGTFFPDNKNKFKNIRSPKMLKPIIEILYKNNFYINNLDINLICEKPKVSKYRTKIINSLSYLLNLDKDLINLKGKTVEKLGLIGKEKAIACEVICSISQ